LENILNFCLRNSLHINLIHTSVIKCCGVFDDIRWYFMQKLDFKFPLTVSCVHFICSSIGAYIAIHVLKAKPLIQVEPEDRWKRIFPMSFVFCINIVLGNVSLRYIPVSFMQTIKSFTPATTGWLCAFSISVISLTFPLAIMLWCH
jgi:hypothetical protein